MRCNAKRCDDGCVLCFGFIAQGRTPLEWAARRGWTDMLAAFLRADVRPARAHKVCAVVRLSWVWHAPVVRAKLLCAVVVVCAWRVHAYRTLQFSVRRPAAGFAALCFLMVVTCA